MEYSNNTIPRRTTKKQHLPILLRPDRCRHVVPFGITTVAVGVAPFDETAPLPPTRPSPPPTGDCVDVGVTCCSMRSF